MVSEYATDRDEPTTPPRDASSPPEGCSVPMGSEDGRARVVSADGVSTLVVGDEVIAPISPADACVCEKIGPPEDESPFNETTIYELIDLLRGEFEASMRKRRYWFGECSRANEWPKVKARILRFMEESKFDYSAVAGFLMEIKCDLVNTGESDRFVIPEPNANSESGKCFWVRAPVQGNVESSPNAPKAKPLRELTMAPLYVGGKLVQRGG